MVSISYLKGRETATDAHIFLAVILVILTPLRSIKLLLTSRGQTHTYLAAMALVRDCQHRKSQMMQQTKFTHIFFVIILGPLQSRQRAPTFV